MLFSTLKAKSGDTWVGAAIDIATEGSRVNIPKGALLRNKDAGFDKSKSKKSDFSHGGHSNIRDNSALCNLVAQSRAAQLHVR
jgi:hypothetical protein